MTINDLPLNEFCVKVRQLAEQLPILMRDGKVRDFAMALSDIEMNARDCQYRLNDLLAKRGESHPLAEQMGT